MFIRKKCIYCKKKKKKLFSLSKFLTAVFSDCQVQGVLVLKVLEVLASSLPTKQPNLRLLSPAIKMKCVYFHLVFNTIFAPWLMLLCILANTNAENLPQQILLSLQKIGTASCRDEKIVREKKDGHYETSVQ